MKPSHNSSLSSVDVYSFLQAPHQNAHATVATILKAYADRGSAVDGTPLLTQTDTARVLCALSHQAEQFFSDAAERLSLPALCHFIRHLCRASHDQLYRSTATKSGTKVWWPRRAWQQHHKDSMPLALLLHRVGDVTLRVFRSSRPLLHVLRIWAITGPHLMDVSAMEWYPEALDRQLNLFVFFISLVRPLVIAIGRSRSVRSSTFRTL